MVQTHSRTPQNSTQWVSTLLAHGGSYRVVTTLSRARRCRPPEALALESQGTGSPGSSISPCCPRSRPWVRIGASHLDAVGGRPRQLSGHPRVPVGLVGSAGQGGHDGQRDPDSGKARPAVDEPACGHWPWRNATAERMDRPTRALVDVQSGAFWASTSPVEVDAESWTLVLWQVEEQAIKWQTSGSDGCRAGGSAVAPVAPKPPHQCDVWQVLHCWKPVQARLDRLVQ